MCPWKTGPLSSLVQRPLERGASEVTCQSGLVDRDSGSDNILPALTGLGLAVVQLGGELGALVNLEKKNTLELCWNTPGLHNVATVSIVYDAKRKSLLRYDADCGKL